MQAVEGDSEGGTPSVTAFATKDELMTVFDLDGSDDTVGKLVFGKNSSGNAQEWYIVGKDKGVSGENTIIWDAGALAPISFIPSDSGSSDKIYNPDWECTYPGATPISVYVNHYGGSWIREALKTWATNTNYFTTAEQRLMNDTTVTTWDEKNKMDYTTTDRLYLLQGELSKTTLSVGSGVEEKTLLILTGSP